MDTNVQALKGLYAALNGDPKDVENMDTSSEVITAMQDVAAAAATELPVVAKKDAGKVLTVNGNGKWSAAFPETEIDDTEASETKTYSSSKIESLIPSPELPTVTSADNGKVLGVANGAWTKTDNIFIINVTKSGGNKTADKTYDEMIEAFLLGKTLLVYEHFDANNIYPLCGATWTINEDTGELTIETMRFLSVTGYTDEGNYFVYDFYEFNSNGINKDFQIVT